MTVTYDYEVACVRCGHKSLIAATTLKVECVECPPKKSPADGVRPVVQAQGRTAREEEVMEAFVAGSFALALAAVGVAVNCYGVLAELRAEQLLQAEEINWLRHQLTPDVERDPPWTEVEQERRLDAIRAVEDRHD